MAILSFNLNWEVKEVLANKHTTASRTGKRKFDSIQLAFFILKTEVEACRAGTKKYWSLKEWD